MLPTATKRQKKKMRRDYHELFACKIINEVWSEVSKKRTWLAPYSEPDLLAMKSFMECRITCCHFRPVLFSSVSCF